MPCDEIDAALDHGVGNGKGRGGVGNVAQLGGERLNFGRESIKERFGGSFTR